MNNINYFLKEKHMNITLIDTNLVCTKNEKKLEIACVFFDLDTMIINKFISIIVDLDNINDENIDIKDINRLLHNSELIIASSKKLLNLNLLNILKSTLFILISKPVICCHNNIIVLPDILRHKNIKVLSGYILKFYSCMNNKNCGDTLFLDDHSCLDGCLLMHKIFSLYNNFNKFIIDFQKNNNS
jgi:hypothetical protein